MYDSLTHAYPEKAVHLRFFVCRWVRGEPQALGCADFRWVGLDEIDGYEFPAADARLLEKIKADKELFGQA